MRHPLRKKYGFTSRKWQARLALLGLGRADRALGPRLRDDVIAPNIDKLIERFFDVLLADADTRRFLRTPSVLESLQNAQRDYLLSLGVDFHRADYCEERLRVGLAHAHVGLPLDVYQCALCQLQTQILDCLPERARAGGPERSPLVDFLLKITTLDTSLTVEAYHGAEVEHLETSIDELRGEGRRLRRAATRDALTRISNRKHTLATLGERLRAGSRRDALWAAMADLDHFKAVNDWRGHLVGDEVLRGAARRIASALRSTDLVGRYGGEEFLVILSGASTEVALEIVERIRLKLGSTPIAVDGMEIPITISIGLAQARPGDSVESLIARADEALYEAKRAGRNRVVFHGEAAGGKAPVRG
jgi:diguanylate cyclase (GGDEF)-like protein